MNNFQVSRLTVSVNPNQIQSSRSSTNGTTGLNSSRLPAGKRQQLILGFKHLDKYKGIRKATGVRGHFTWAKNSQFENTGSI